MSNEDTAAGGRLEDPPFLTGAADYTHDVERPRMVHLAVLRSPHAHAEVRGIDATDAETADGVVAVFTAADVRASGTENRLDSVAMTVAGEGLEDRDYPRIPLLAEERVRYQGNPVAVVVAEDPYAAHEAADRIDVDYIRLDAVADPREAVEGDAPPVYEEVPSNVAFEWTVGDADPVDAAFDAADLVVDVDVTHPRVFSNPIEPRAVVAAFDEGTGRLDVELSTQTPHHHRGYLSRTLGLPEGKIHVDAPNVGGGFGTKAYHYPEEALAAWCAVQVGRPVAWRGTRTEAHLADAHGRGHRTTAELAVDAEGRIEALRADTYGVVGAYVSSHAPNILTKVYAGLLPGPLDVPLVHARVVGAYTHTAPVDAYRGAGQPEATLVTQRLLHMAARELGLDPVELLRRNFVRPDQFPYQSATGAVYDSGDYEGALDLALDLADYEGRRAEQERLREEGRYLGVGVASCIEFTGLGPSNEGPLSALPAFSESSVVRFHPSGTVTAYTGMSAHGQSHDTVFTRLLSDRLGVPERDIEIIQNDTDAVPRGSGTFASRGAVVGGSSLVTSADRVVERAREIAAHRLEADVADVGFDDGEFSVAGAPERAVHITEIARQAHFDDDLPEGVEPALEATAFYQPDGAAVSFGTHVAVVEVDPETGELDLRQYVAVSDCGEQLDPQVVEGQIHGGIAQGLGPALAERVVYDENATLLTGSLGDYAMPQAADLPDFDTDFTVTPSPTNPLGVKGAGQLGTVPAPTALVNAVVDALEPFGVEHLDIPLAPERVWRAIREAEQRRG